MFLSGHEAIVAEVLRECFGGRYFEDPPLRRHRGCSEAALVQGLRYVDAPCGRYTLNDGFAD